MFNHHSIIPWGSFRGRQEEKWGSFRDQFGDHIRVGDHFGVGIISGAVQSSAVKRGVKKKKTLESLSNSLRRPLLRRPEVKKPQNDAVRMLGNDLSP